MIISKTPYRISFFGGGSDYPEWYNSSRGEVISTTINKYIYVSCRHLPPLFDHKYTVSYSKIERKNNIRQIEHKVVKHMLSKLNIKSGLEIHYDGDLPSRSGMGSSSSFVIGLMKVLNAGTNVKKSKRDLALSAINFEKNILKENVGSQDQVAAVYGGFNNIVFDKKNIFKVRKMNINSDYLSEFDENLHLYYTGIKRYSSHITKKFSKYLPTKKSKYIKTMLDLTKESKNNLLSGKIDLLGELLNDSWQIKKELDKDVSSKTINEMYSYGIKSGSTGGKLLGAGGGGFILFYVPKKNRNIFLKKMKKIPSVNFNFSNEGSKIIFDNNEKKF